MILSLFDQFMSPIFMHIPLIAIAMALPWMFWPKPTMRWMNNRVVALQSWFMAHYPQHILIPVRENGHKWAAFFTALMIFLLSLNMFGLLPYTFTPTTQLSLNIGLAVPLWLMTVITGLRYRTTATFAHFLPQGTPTALIPALIIIETISLFIRPIALGVRLTANLTAGHLLIQLISTAAFALLSIMPVVIPLMATLLILLTILEVAVAAIQAYVFVLLLTLYLQESL
nr:ATP synthase F0 subunit 6 [Polydactylus virginicus]